MSIYDSAYVGGFLRVLERDFTVMVNPEGLSRDDFEAKIVRAVAFRLREGKCEFVNGAGDVVAAFREERVRSVHGDGAGVDGSTVWWGESGGCAGPEI